MFVPRPSASLPATEPDHGGDGAFYRRVLHELIAYGADVAKALHGQVAAMTQPAAVVCEAGAAPDAGQAETVARVAEVFERVARGVRRGVALARRLDEPAVAGPNRAGLRRELIRRVEDRIERAALVKPVDTEGVEAEFAERLEMPDLEEQIGSRPVADIVNDICSDLGLSSLSGCRRRRPADIAALCERAARPGGGGLRVVADALPVGIARPAEGAPMWGTNRFRRE